MYKSFLFFLIFIFCITLCSCNFWGFGVPDKVLLERVRSVVLKDKRWTTGRRRPGIPQLRCTGGVGNEHCQVKANVVQCVNVGFDGNAVQWKCESQLEDGYTFGSLEMICEGYDYPTDQYILKDSCGLEYSINKLNPEDTKKRATIPTFFIFLFLSILLIVCIISIVFGGKGGAGDGSGGKGR